jgi:hypothetical protein
VGLKNIEQATILQKKEQQRSRGKQNGVEQEE